MMSKSSRHQRPSDIKDLKTSKKIWKSSRLQIGCRELKASWLDWQKARLEACIVRPEWGANKRGANEKRANDTRANECRKASERLEEARLCIYVYYIWRRANEEKANERRANECMEGEKLICIYLYIWRSRCCVKSKPLLSKSARCWVGVWTRIINADSQQT